MFYSLMEYLAVLIELIKQPCSVKASHKKNSRIDRCGSLELG